MAVTRYTLTGNISTLSGVEFDSMSRVAAFIECNASDFAIIDLVANQIQLGTAAITFAADGTFSLSLIASNSADINATGIQYQVHLNYPDDNLGRRVDWSSGWFSLTANTNLATVLDEQYVPPNYQNEFMARTQELADDLRTEMQALIDEATDIRDDMNAIVVTDLTVSDGQLSTLLNNPASASRASLMAVYDAELMPLYLMGVI